MVREINQAGLDLIKSFEGIPDGDPSTVNAESLDPSSGGYDGAIIRIDPSTGNQTPLARGQGSYLNPRGVAVVPVAAVSAKH